MASTAPSSAARCRLAPSLPQASGPGNATSLHLRPSLPRPSPVHRVTAPSQQSALPCSQVGLSGSPAPCFHQPSPSPHTTPHSTPLATHPPHHPRPPPPPPQTCLRHARTRPWRFLAATKPCTSTGSTCCPPQTSSNTLQTTVGGGRAAGWGKRCVGPTCVVAGSCACACHALLFWAYPPCSAGHVQSPAWPGVLLAAHAAPSHRLYATTSTRCRTVPPPSHYLYPTSCNAACPSSRPQVCGVDQRLISQHCVC